PTSVGRRRSCWTPARRSSPGVRPTSSTAWRGRSSSTWATSSTTTPSTPCSATISGCCSWSRWTARGRPGSRRSRCASTTPAPAWPRAPTTGGSPGASARRASPSGRASPPKAAAWSSRPRPRGGLLVLEGVAERPVLVHEGLGPVRGEVGLGAVHVGEAVLLVQAPRRQGAPGLRYDVGVGGQCGDGPPEVGGRLGVGEVRILGDGVPPVLLGDAEVVEDRLRAQETRRDGHGGDPVRLQLGGLREGQADHRGLRDVVE